MSLLKSGELCFPLFFSNLTVIYLLQANIIYSGTVDNYQLFLSYIKLCSKFAVFEHNYYNLIK